MSDLTIYRGIAWQRLLTVTEPDGTRKSLTGATVTVNVRRNFIDNADAFTLAIGDGVTLLADSGDTVGQATIDVGGVVSADLAIENYIIRVLVQPLGEATPQIVIPWRKIAVRP